MFDEPAERQAISELRQALQDAWNRGDAAGYASLFTEDADFVAWTGAHGRGRRAIEDGHRPLFGGPLAGSVMTLSGADDAAPESLGSPRFVRPDVAIMVTSGAVTLAGQRAPEASAPGQSAPGQGTTRQGVADPDHQSVQTFVLAKNEGRWQVAAFQNTRKP